MSESAPSRGQSNSRVAEHGLGEGVDAVEVDLGRRERGVEPRRPVVVGPGIAEAPGHGHAIELELEPIDRDGVIAERDLAGEAQRTGGNGLRVGAIGQPGEERARIVRFDLGRSLELHARGRRAEAPVETDLGHAGRAEIQSLDIEMLGIGLQLGADALQRRAAEGDGVDAEAQRGGDG